MSKVWCKYCEAMVDPVLEDFHMSLESIDVYTCPLCGREVEGKMNNVCKNPQCSLYSPEATTYCTVACRVAHRNCNKAVDILRSNLDPETLTLVLRLLDHTNRENYTVELTIEEPFIGYILNLSNTKQGIRCSIKYTGKDIDTIIDWSEFDI